MQRQENSDRRCSERPCCWGLPLARINGRKKSHAGNRFESLPNTGLRNSSTKEWEPRHTRLGLEGPLGKRDHSRRRHARAPNRRNGACNPGTPHDKPGGPKGPKTPLRQSTHPPTTQLWGWSLPWTPSDSIRSAQARKGYRKRPRDRAGGARVQERQAADRCQFRSHRRPVGGCDSAGQHPREVCGGHGQDEGMPAAPSPLSRTTLALPQSGSLATERRATVAAPTLG